VFGLIIVLGYLGYSLVLNFSTLVNVVKYQIQYKIIGLSDKKVDQKYDDLSVFTEFLSLALETP